MQSNLIRWLFEDAWTANTNAGISGAEVFRFFWPWLIFCIVGLLLTFYYSVEGRKRFVRDKPVLKAMLDRYLGWFAVICFVGLPLLAARSYMDGYFFAWRFWRYAWLVALLAWGITWIVYLVRKYPQERAGYRYRENRLKYIPKGNRRKAKAASR